MSTSEVTQQLQVWDKADIGQDLAEQTLLRSACIERGLGSPSDRNGSISHLGSLGCVQALEKLASTPRRRGSSLAKLKVHCEQQAQVMGKLEALWEKLEAFQRASSEQMYWKNPGALWPVIPASMAADHDDLYVPHVTPFIEERGFSCRFVAI